jgi:integrase
MSAKRRKPARIRIGRVSIYFHHNAWWLYYRSGGKVCRIKSGSCQLTAEQQAGQIHGQLSLGQLSVPVNGTVDVVAVKQQFLDHHEFVRKSSMNTVRRYRAALVHLVNYVNSLGRKLSLHLISVDAFVCYLRQLEVAPNGHPNSPKRRLRDTGIRYILEVCRSLLSFASNQRLLPPYATNPFICLPWDRLRVEDSKHIFVFDESIEIAFWNGACPWSFALHFVLAKTGMRIGELVHLLIEDLDLVAGWLTVRNKLTLGWRVKTGNNRRIPLLPEVVVALKSVIGDRKVGPVFLRLKYRSRASPMLVGSLAELEAVYQQRLQQAQSPKSRRLELQIAKQVWWDAGVVKADQIRTSFIRTMRQLGRNDSTCPKSWRHTFATLLQDANVDPLIRQLTLGHRPSLQTGLGMTSVYTHTRPETQRCQIEAALRQWPTSLSAAMRKLEA